MPSLLKELFETEREVASAEDAYLYNKRGAPSSTQFIAQPRSRIRERATSIALARLRDPSLSLGALELAEPQLSPEFRSTIDQVPDLRRGAERRLLQQFRQIQAQNIAADAEERAYAKAGPLTQNKIRDGLFRRSDQDRIASILGSLQRERRQSAPLTREAWARAKAIAAKRRLDPYVVQTGEIALAGDFSDPCVEYRLTQARRRETFFAKGQIVAGGYAGRRGSSRSPC